MSLRSNSPTHPPLPVPRRWPWLLLVLVTGVLAFGMQGVLHEREQRARTAEMQATLFATELRDTVGEITRFSNAVPPRQRVAVVRPIVTAATELADRRLADLEAALDDPSRASGLHLLVDRIRRDAATTADRRLFSARLTVTSDSLARVGDAIAAEQHERATLIGRESVAGYGAVLLVTLLLVALIFGRVQRLLLRAGRRHAEQLQDLAEHDPLTGLSNRRRLNSDLATIAPLATDGRPVQILMCDLDGFKALNDTLGHAAGDRLLAGFARRVESAVGADGTVYRLGGDEFCVVSAPGVDLAARVVEAVESADPETDASAAAHGSVGAALWPGEARTASAAMRLADDRMYAAKARHHARAAA